MTEVTTSEGREAVELSPAGEQLLPGAYRAGPHRRAEARRRARSAGKLTKMVIEGALEDEFGDHLRYVLTHQAARNLARPR